jgi:protein tyrosine phosphatase
MKFCLLQSSPIYWPEGSASETYGQFDVELISVNKESSTVWWRQFSLTNSKDRGAEPMNVLQYQFAAGIWLNKFSIPSKTSSILQLTKLLTNNTGKIILQCSEGASRSGLVAAAMHMIDMMKVEQIVDVFLVCRYIIVNRPQAIEDLNQYRFLHDLALECINEHDQYDNLQSATIYVNLPSP